jgi:GrpB-like predicted nucleotidyltransferase (UPF0157 family)
MAPIKKIEIFPYNPEWPRLFEDEVIQIKSFLGDHCLKIHHIGSTSVPGLAAKEDLDILCVVDKLSSALELQRIGYVFKGELNIPLRYFFSKNTSVSKVNLHVTEEKHGFIDLNLSFRDYLRSHPERRQAYQELKDTLLQDPSSFERGEGRFPNYTLRKNQFIKDTLREAGYTGTTFVFCTHEAEWEVANRLSQQDFSHLGASDANSPDANSASDLAPKTLAPKTLAPQILHHPDHLHIVMYRGVDSIAYAHVLLQNNSGTATIKLMATDPTMDPTIELSPESSQNLLSEFLDFVKKYVATKGRSLSFTLS